MQTISIKIDENLLRAMKKLMREHRYSTQTEFIREAIREKIEEAETKAALKRLDKIYGASKRRTTDEELHEAGERAFEEIEKKLETRDFV